MTDPILAALRSPHDDDLREALIKASDTIVGASAALDPRAMRRFKALFDQAYQQLYEGVRVARRKVQ